ncbi:MAG TPA: hypothetical protein ENN03_00085 [bacterium]|nr:hypothetical protein [bacterium]
MRGRKKWILLGSLIIIILIPVFFLDGWIEAGLEKGMQAVTGARVEIDGFRFRPLTLSFSWKRFQAADPGHAFRNMAETDRVKYQMQWKSLFQGRVAIDTVWVDNLRFGTDRAADGRLPHVSSPPRSERSGPLERFEAELERAILKSRARLETLSHSVHVDSLLNRELTFPGRIDSARIECGRTASRWDSILEFYRPLDRVGKLRKRAASLDPQKIKSVPEGLRALKTLDEIRREWSPLKDSIQVWSVSLESDVRRLGNLPGQVRGWAEADYSRLRDRLVPDLNPESVGEMVFGPMMLKQLQNYVRYWRIVHRVLDKNGDEKTKKSKIREPGRPAFHLGIISAGVHTKDQRGNAGTWHGSATHITTEPRVLGQPTGVRLEYARDDTRSLISGFFDHTAEPVHDRIEWSFRGLPIKGWDSGEDYLPKLKSGQGDLQGNFSLKNRQWDGILEIRLHDSAWNFQGESVLSRIWKGISGQTVKVTARAGGGEGSFRLSVQSNLDNLLSEELKKEALARVHESAAELDRKLWSEYDKAVSGLNEERLPLQLKLESILSSLKSSGELDILLKNLSETLKNRL